MTNETKTKSLSRPQVPVEVLRANAQAQNWCTGKKVCIVGFTDHKKYAPFDDPEWEIWGCNKLWQHVDGQNIFDRIYDPHGINVIRNHDPEQAEWLAKTNVPAFVMAEQEDWPTSVQIPHEHLRAGRSYYTNTISWMIAHALYEGPPAELMVVGVDMATGTEYAQQRPSCEYWIGVAEAMGVKVWIPEESDLLKSSVAYGLEDDSAIVVKKRARRQELADRLAQVQAQLNQLDSSYRAQQLQLVNMIGQCQGAIEQIEYDLAVWHPAMTRGSTDITAMKRMIAQSDGQKVA